MKKITTLSFCTLLSISTSAFAETNHDHHHHHNHAVSEPIGIMGGHIHEKGDWMVSYRYGNMKMDGNRNGTSDVSTSDVLADFMVSPLEMTMEMHMLGVMYGLTDRLTIMAMAPYIDLSMDHVTAMGMNFTTEAKGIGDVKLSGNYLYKEYDNNQVILNAGVSFPTGSIDERDDTPMGTNMKLPYPMQLGSGSFELRPGITYVSQRGDWSWGTQINAVLRIGRNSNDYRKGHEFGYSVWGAKKMTEAVTASIRFNGLEWGDVHGADPDLNPMMVPTARTDLRAGRRIDALFGLEFAPKAFQGNILAIEYGTPIFQHLDGPQLETDNRFMVGWKKGF